MPDSREALNVTNAMTSAATGSNQTLATALIGLFTLVTTILIMYLIARGTGGGGRD